MVQIYINIIIIIIYNFRFVKSENADVRSGKVEKWKSAALLCLHSLV